MAAQPLHESISAKIRERIATGEWGEGTIIPSEVELSEEFGVSRPTIRHALEPLVAEGLLDRRRKRGTMVRPAKLATPLASSLAPVTSAAEAAGRVARTEVSFLRHVRADATLARVLGVAEGDDVVRAGLLYLADEQPVAYEEASVPAAYAAGLEAADLTQTSLVDALAQGGTAVSGARRRLEVVPLQAQVATLLDVADQTPAFLVRGVLLGEGGQAVAVTTAWYRGDANAFEVEVSA